MQKKCTVCGIVMKVKPCLVERKKYCSMSCALKGWKGQRRSRGTEFSKGQVGHNKLDIGVITARYSKRSKCSRRWIKIKEPNEWILYCRYLWEKAYGEIPSGLIVHHVDRNTMNDKLSNLSLLSRAQHLADHRSEFEFKRRRNVAFKNKLAKASAL